MERDEIIKLPIRKILDSYTWEDIEKKFSPRSVIEVWLRSYPGDMGELFVEQRQKMPDNDLTKQIEEEIYYRNLYRAHLGGNKCEI